MGKTKKAAKKKPTKAGNLRARFVDEFLIDRNGSEAARRAGYAPRSAGVTACKLLKDPKISAEISKRTAEQAAKAQISADRVMQEYVALALLDPLDLLNADGTIKPLDQVSEPARRAIAGLEIFEEFQGRGKERKFIGFTKKLKFGDKKGALDSIAKILGMMRERVEVSADVTLGALLAQSRKGE